MFFWFGQNCNLRKYFIYLFIYFTYCISVFRKTKYVNKKIIYRVHSFSNFFFFINIGNSSYKKKNSVWIINLRVNFSILKTQNFKNNFNQEIIYWFYRLLIRLTKILSAIKKKKAESSFDNRKIWKLEIFFINFTRMNEPIEKVNRRALE